MGQVISLKAHTDALRNTVLARREEARKVYIHRSNLTWNIRCQRHTTDTLKDLITSMPDPRDQFVARQMWKEENNKLESLEAEYVGFYGEMDF